MSTAVETAEAPMILQEVRDGVGIITLNRPDRLNAWAPPMGPMFFDMLEAMGKDPAVRVILVTGAGRGFCSGVDVGWLGDISAGKNRQDAKPDTRPFWLPLSIGKPIVSAVQGACVGFGTVLALFSDIRFVADDLKFGIVYGKRGLVAELAVSWILPRIVGVSAAMDLLLSGRHIGAQEAREIGLASRVFPADQLFDGAFEYCREMAANCAPWAMRGMKQQLYADLTNRLDESYGRSFVLLNQALKSADFAEGLSALKERRAPQFPPLAADLWSIDIFGEPGATKP